MWLNKKETLTALEKYSTFMEHIIIMYISETFIGFLKHFGVSTTNSISTLSVPPTNFLAIPTTSEASHGLSQPILIHILFEYHMVDTTHLSRKCEPHSTTYLSTHLNLSNQSAYLSIKVSLFNCKIKY